MKRRLTICTVYATLIGLVLLCALGMNRPVTGAGGLSANAVGFSAKKQSSYQTYYNVYTMNPALNHAAVNIVGVTGAIADSVKVDNQDRAIVVADSLQDLSLGHVYQLGVDDTTFAYAQIDTLWTATAGLDELVTNSNRKKYYTLKAEQDWHLLDAGSSRARPLLIHFDPKVPTNATVVRATLHLNTEGAYTSGNDSTIAVLMSQDGWGSWYKYRGQWNTWNNADPGSGDTWWKYAAKCGYTNQVQYKTAADRHGFHYTTRAPWYPAWSTLDRYWEVGDVTDFGSLGNTNGDGGKKYDLQIDITDCVQAIANGATNNGIAIWLKIANADNRSVITSGFELTDRRAAAGWIDVKYSDKPYSTPFPGGKTWAFVFQTDDARKTANDAYYQTFADHDGKYTIYVTKDFLGTSGIATAADLLNWYNTGNEIGAHSRHHIYSTAYQINYWGHGSAANGYAATDTTTYAAGWDSMRTSLKPDWMYALGDSLGIPRHSRHWAKSMALPGNGWSPWTQVICTQLGYQSVRTGQSGVYGLLANSGMGAAFSDTAYCGTGGQKSRAPRNIIMLPTFVGIDAIVGVKGNTHATEDSIKANMRKCVEQIKACNIPVLSLYVHDLKTDPSGTGYAEGLDQEELDWLLDVVDAEGGCYMTATEYVDYMRANSVPIDRPHSAHRDSFPFFNSVAQDKSWIRPNGIDNRWIPSLYNATAGLSYDTLKPSAPASLAAYGADGSVTLVWPASTSPDVQIYKVYKFYDNSPDTTYVTAQSAVYTIGGYCTYTDQSVVNGTPHNYFVTAVDGAGNESADSPHAYDTPMANQLSPGRPAYFALWFDDPGSGLSATSRDSILNILDDFDAVVTGPFAMEGIVREDFYDDLVSDLRQRNSDEIVLMYVNPWMVRYSPADTASQLDRNYTRRIMDYADSGADSSGYALNDAAHIVRGYEYRVATTGSQTRVINFMRAGAADTMAFIWAEAYEKLATGMQGNYTGLFVDDLSVVPGYLMQIAGAPGYDSFSDVVDANQDAVPFGSDDEELAAFEAYHVSFLKALRREFAQRGLDNRLIVGNTTFGRADEPGANAVTAFGLMDGAMVEGANVWWPGTAAADTTWDKVFAIRTLLENSQVSPPMGMIMMATDSSAVYQSEVLALASDTWVNVSMNAHSYEPLSLPRRLPSPGLSTGYSIEAGNPDTLTATWTNMTARIALERNPVNAADAGAVWPYIVYAGTDTLSRSLFWERASEEGSPSPTLYQTITGDSRITMLLMILDDNTVWLPSDYSHHRIIKSWEDETVQYDTLTVDADTLPHWDRDNPGGDAYLWFDDGLTNGVEYCYSVSVWDVLGNHSAEFSPPDQCRTPTDTTPPPEGPTNVSASGGEGFVALDWEYPNQPEDFDHFSIGRRLNLSGTDYPEIGTSTTSAYNDSTALSGQLYDYVVEAVDDAGWKAYIGDSQATGGWFGTVAPSYPPPSNVRALADNPSGSTAVVVYPPTDTTGLTSYSIYRGRYTIAPTDTATCTLYKTGLTPDAFNGCVFYDTHATNGASPDTAFQYTATALYSGHRSTKYAVPAWALSTGGISQQTPTVSAYGRGTDIGVAVGPVAGCDSTRIFRGTTVGTQTYIGKVAVANNPYIDTTALPNTDYYYKVRNSASAGTILTQFSNVSGPVRWVSVPAGSPAISGVTGTIANGQSVVISGANFGSKTLAAPKVWDNFDSGTNGGVIATGTNWTRTSGDEATTRAPRYNNSTSHSGSNSAFCAFDGSSYRSSFSVVDATRLGHEFYLDAWTWYVPGTNPSRSWKPWIMYDNTGGESVLIDWYGGCNNRSTVSTHSGGSNIAGQTWLDINEGMDGSVLDFASGWHHFKVYAKLSSPAGTRTGVSWVWLDGNVICDRTNMYLLAADATRTWGDLAIGCYTSHDQRDNTGGVQAGCYEPVGNPYQYWDDVYVDGTRSRVEIGNNATYSLCTHTEIQIPSAWASNGTSITATLNTGTFTNGTAYLFVVDSDGNASAGQSITIANP